MLLKGLLDLTRPDNIRCIPCVGDNLADPVNEGLCLNTPEHLGIIGNTGGHPGPAAVVSPKDKHCEGIKNCWLLDPFLDLIITLGPVLRAVSPGGPVLELLCLDKLGLEAQDLEVLARIWGIYLRGDAAE